MTTNKPTELVVTQAGIFTEENMTKAAAETERLTRELDITNADHVVLWLEANMVNEDNLEKHLGWLACQIVEAHEAAHRLASTAPASEDEMEIVAQAIEPETFLLPRINLNKPVYDRAYKRARAAIAALRPRSERD